jgi:hypothetical protein
MPTAEETAEETAEGPRISSPRAARSSLVGRRRIPAERRSLAALLFAAGILAAGGAAAQSDPAQVRVAAQALYDEAMRDVADKAYDRACPKLEQVVRLVPEGVGARLQLGECYKAAGKLASAWSSYSMAESTAAQRRDPRETVARGFVQSLWPKLARLTVIVAPDVAALGGLEIKRDSVLIPEAQWGSPVPIDQGKHVVEATANGKKRWTTTVEVPKDGVPITVSIEPLADAPIEAPPPVASPPTESAPRTPAPILPPNPSGEMEPRGGSPQKTAGLVVGALGVVGLGVGGFAGLRAMQAKTDSNTAPSGSTTAPCRADDRCDPQGLALRASAISAARWSTGLFVASGIALASGVVLFVTAPSMRKDPPVKVSLGPTHLTIAVAW